MRDAVDTIVAVSSAAVLDREVTESIVRISGPHAFPAVGHIVDSPVPPTERGITRQRIILGNTAAADAIVYSFPGPFSYTGEDVVEMHTLAAPCMLEGVLSRLRPFARPATPGEFVVTNGSPYQANPAGAGCHPGPTVVKDRWSWCSFRWRRSGRWPRRRCARRTSFAPRSFRRRDRCP